MKAETGGGDADRVDIAGTWYAVESHGLDGTDWWRNHTDHIGTLGEAKAIVAELEARHAGRPRVGFRYRRNDEAGYAKWEERSVR